MRFMGFGLCPATRDFGAFRFEDTPPDLGDPTRSPPRRLPQIDPVDLLEDMLELVRHELRDIRTQGQFNSHLQLARRVAPNRALRTRAPVARPHERADDNADP